MCAHFLFRNVFTVFVFFMLPNISTSDDSQLQYPDLRFHLIEYRYRFRAGELVPLVIEIHRDFNSEEDRRAFTPHLQIVKGRSRVFGFISVADNSSLMTGVWCDIYNLRIYFIPIMTGNFDMNVSDPRFRVDSPLMHYRVDPGPIYEPGGMVSWMDEMHDCVAGTKATVLILPKDAFGNTVTSTSEGQNIYNFEVYATSLNGSNAKLQDVSNKGWIESGYILIEFVSVTSGHLLVHIKNKNDSLIGSPLPLTVHPEALDVANCLAHWSSETKSFQLFSTMETLVTQRDKYGNLVPGLCEFDFEVLEMGTNLSLPIRDLQYKEVSPGVQSFSFKVVKPGDFVLIITDKNNIKIMNVPYVFTVYIGYCDGMQSVVNGSGLDKSFAGEATKFSILLKDAYQYPSPVELERLQVQITLPRLSLRVNPQIYPKEYANGTQPTGMGSYGAFGPTGMTYVPTVFSHDNSPENSETKSSDFDVVFVPEKTGFYVIRIFCGNIPLNGGQPFYKVVDSGEVNISLSGVAEYAKNASAGLVNSFTVQLMDSFNNPVIFQKTRLLLQMASRDGSHGLMYACLFDDNYNGTYTGSYYAVNPGYYELRVSYDGKELMPWPFAILLLDGNLFPSVRDDTVVVWEDQSIGFDALENDIFNDGNASISEFQRPSHGSVVQYGHLLRYTPYRGYHGYDEFIYTLLDAHGNTGTGRVTIHVRPIPPQFIDLPEQLQAVEDTLTPEYRGFPGFEMVYSDPQESISVKLTAKNGTILLSPLLMQLWDPMWNDLSVSRVEGKDGFLCITGRLEVVNFALNSLQYMGNANFSGKDVIAITTINEYEKRNLKILIFVRAVNDPPVINVPKFIILGSEKENKEFLLFDRQVAKFNFSIEDPDRLAFQLLFPGKESEFRVMFCVEVSSGTFSAKLPAQLISTTELKLKSSNQWQPLLTFVEISKHFTVNKVKGIRFQGTINDCNTLLHQMLYYGDKQDGVLKLWVNDMGWDGCYPDCSEDMAVSLIAEATVSLITRTPMDSLVAHYLGSVIIAESILLAALAVILIISMCKCLMGLSHERKKQRAESLSLQLDEQQKSQEQMVQASAGLPENTIQLTGNDSTSFMPSEQPSDLPNPAEETSVVAEVAAVIL